ncbi:hypothetical protein M5K25_002491 [Dendrobium thyrsiflorum]|uniref:Uncharacterized protein n=1 Tax=Dendrobium thyrsiflorum TaxID=117978 RepID=A0ABD0VMG0_DENTH
MGAEWRTRQEMFCWQIPEDLPAVLHTEVQTLDLSRRAKASMLVDVWIRIFLKERHLFTVRVSLHNPFRLGLQRGDPHFHSRTDVVTLAQNWYWFQFSSASAASCTHVSFTRLTWVRLSFGPALEHGPRRYKRRVHEFGLPRGQTPRRGFSDATFDIRTNTEAYTTAGAIVHSLTRTSSVAPKLPRVETTRPSRRHVGSQRAGVAPLIEFLGEPSHTPIISDLVPAEFSFFLKGHQTDFACTSSVLISYPADSASPPIVSERVDYASKIPCHVPLPLIPGVLIGVAILQIF